jgi:hypothetical protein
MQRFDFSSSEDFRKKARQCEGDTFYVNSKSKPLAKGKGALFNPDGGILGIGYLKVDDSLPEGVCRVKGVANA